MIENLTNPICVTIRNENNCTIPNFVLFEPVNGKAFSTQTEIAVHGLCVGSTELYTVNDIMNACNNSNRSLFIDEIYLAVTSGSAAMAQQFIGYYEYGERDKMVYLPCLEYHDFTGRYIFGRTLKLSSRFIVQLWPYTQMDIKFKVGRQ